MARKASSARRYAEAAFDIAERDGKVEQWRDQLMQAAQALADPAIVRRLEDPAVPFETRAEAISDGLGKEVLPGLRNLLLLVLRRRRLTQVSNIYAEFRRLYNRRAGIVEATAVSATPLSDADVEVLRERLAATVGGKLELTLQVDPTLIGGLYVRIGDRLIDGTVRGRLERLRNTLIASA